MERRGEEEGSGRMKEKKEKKEKKKKEREKKIKYLWFWLGFTNSDFIPFTKFRMKFSLLRILTRNLDYGYYSIGIDKWLKYCGD